MGKWGALLFVCADSPGIPGDFADQAKLETLRDVFHHWVGLDTFNCDLRRMGILRFRMPHQYRVNEVPDRSGFAEQGRWIPTASQLVRR